MSSPDKKTLAEQHRIVAKEDELMGLFDQLEIQLTTTQFESQILIAALLHEAHTGQKDLELSALR